MKIYTEIYTEITTLERVLETVPPQYLHSPHSLTLLFVEEYSAATYVPMLAESQLGGGG